MDKPTASIVIATHNSEETIRYCLDSVLRQTFTDFEVIIVDDHSEDNTVNIIMNEYCLRDKRFKLFVNMTDKNNPFVDAHNHTLKLSNGRYICRLDHDDFLDCEYLSAVVDYMDKHEHVDCLSMFIDFYSYENNILRPNVEYNEYTSVWRNVNDAIGTNTNDIYNMWRILTQNTIWHHNGMVIRKPAYDKYKPQYKYICLGDIIFYIDCYYYGMKFNILYNEDNPDKIYYHARLSDQSLSNSPEFHNQDIIVELNKTKIKILEKYDPDFWVPQDNNYISGMIKEITENINKICYWLN